MKKMTLVLISIITIFSLIACTNTTKETDKKYDINKVKTSEKFEIILTSANLVENSFNTDTKRDTLELGVKAKNRSNTEADIGTGDFYIEGNKGKKYTFTGSENNFGGVLKPNEMLSGKGYYSIPENFRGKEIVVIYQPFKSTEQVKWNILIPAKVVKDK
ncbi:DUF4352 domain-containing protein [Listeria weihenstephanensis]|uniref:DUF4352 domain-containing protein n=1 Tax=Listeria weihenstephanensis TaxID=1006155 RepID=A0A841Z9M7_9LIST|nr:DUF4352 domain-containing protein [Listeria weihenstephanensis]MBC1501874.1 DUF4352 domain-containing protein [Listeria weihenstephanensis]